MEPVTLGTLTAFLKRLDQPYTDQATFYLLVDSALLLLGNPRQTLDINYTTELNLERRHYLEDSLKQLAAQFRLDIEAFPGKFYSFETRVVISLAAGIYPRISRVSTI